MQRGKDLAEHRAVCAVRDGDRGASQGGLDGCGLQEGVLVVQKVIRDVDVTSESPPKLNAVQCTWAMGEFCKLCVLGLGRGEAWCVL